MGSIRVPGPIDRIEATVAVPGSKSLTNRALVAAAAAGGGRMSGALECEDTLLLSQALAAMGWDIEGTTRLRVGGRTSPSGEVRVDLGNSGTGARLLMALAAVQPGEVFIDGTPRLRQRPMAPLIDALRALGGEVASDEGCLPVRVSGRRLAGGRLQLEPQMSSQFASALLMAAPLMTNGLTLRLVGAAPSLPYLLLTRNVLRAFGASIDHDEGLRRWEVAAGGLRPCRYAVGGDWSAAAFFLAAAASAPGFVDVGPLQSESPQADRAVLGMLAQAGLGVHWAHDRVIAHGPLTTGLDADLRHCPDLFPALAAVASGLSAPSRLRGLENLAYKESDRMKVMADNLRRLGADLVLGESSLEVRQPVQRRPDQVRRVTAAADHRIAMAMAVTAIAAGPLEIDDRDCVSKSFPGFWEQWRALAS